MVEFLTIADSNFHLPKPCENAAEKRKASNPLSIWLHTKKDPLPFLDNKFSFCIYL